MNTWKGYLPMYPDDFARAFVTRFCNHEGWSKAKKDGRKLAKKRKKRMDILTEMCDVLV